MKVTLREAAQAVGRNKSTIFRAIQDGKLQSETNEAGVMFVSMDDLIVLYPPETPETRMQARKRGRPAGSRKTPEPHDALSALPQEIMRLNQEVLELKSKLETSRAKNKADHLRISDLTIERERIGNRNSQLEQDMDKIRADNLLKAEQIIQLRNDNDILLKKLNKIEDSLKDLAKDKEVSKKGLLEKIFSN